MADTDEDMDMTALQKALQKELEGEALPPQDMETLITDTALHSIKKHAAGKRLRKKFRGKLKRR